MDDVKDDKSIHFSDFKLQSAYFPFFVKIVGVSENNYRHVSSTPSSKK
jgi:hypothetical protein